MGTISLTLPVAGTDITAGPLATDFTTIQNVINGNIDNANVNASAAIVQSKIAFDGWQTYTPAWTAASVNPVIGNGTILGRYAQVGKTIHVRVVITMGSTTTFGTGVYSISTPVAAHASEQGIVGPVRGSDAGVADYIGQAVFGSTTTFLVFTNTNPVAAFYSSAQPFTWATGDIIALRATYEAA